MMDTKDFVDAVLRGLGLLISWPVIFLIVVILVRQKLPELVSTLSARITKAPGGFEFAVLDLQQKVETLNTKIAQLERVTFQPSTALTEGLQTQLKASFESFQKYLVGLDYKPETGNVKVYVDPDLADNVYYDEQEQRIVLGAPLATDTDAVFREYTHHALMATFNWKALTQEQKAIESALADYFPCSFSNDALFGERSVHLFRRFPGFENKIAIRNLDNDRKLSDLPAVSEYHDVGEVWGGAFWELRQKIEQNMVDKLLFSTWVALRSQNVSDEFGRRFVEKLLETAKSPEYGKRNEDIRTVFQRRGMNL